jgi:hypothetical protein
MLAGTSINPQIPQIMGNYEIPTAGEINFGEEGFGEYIKAAVSQLQKPQTQEQPAVIAKSDYTDEENILASYLLSMAKPLTDNVQLTIDNVQLPIELENEINVTPQIPEIPQFTETPQIPEQANPETTQEPLQRSPRELFIEYSGIIREIVFGEGYEGYEIPTVEQIMQAISRLEAEGKIEAAQARLIENYAHAIKLVNAGIPQAGIPEADLAVFPVIDEENPAEIPAPRENHGVVISQEEIKFVEPEKFGIFKTEQAQETPVKLAQGLQSEQIPQEIHELFKQLKVTAENQAQIPETPEESDELMKAWETVQKNHVEIKEKPAEMNELLERAKVIKAETAEKPQNTQKPVGRDVLDTPQTPTTINFEPKPVILEKAELPQLPQTTVTQVSEQILAKLETTANGTTTFEMMLNPLELGKIAVKIVMTATGTAIEIIAEKATTAQLLQNSADRIGLALEKGETKLESFVVSVEEKSDYSEQRENQRNNKQEQQQNSEREEDYDGISFEELLNTL